MLSDEDVEAATAVLKHFADEDTVREKMKATFISRQSLVNDEKKAADVFSVFPCFLNTQGHLHQSKSYKEKSWTGAHHRPLGITVQC